MKMPKPGAPKKELFQRLLPQAPGVTQRPMFGQLVGFVNGNMFLCLFGDQIAVKLPEEQADELLAIDGSGPLVPMEGRPMRGYVTLPEAWHDGDPRADVWVERSLEYVGSLPPKEKKKK
ncbi:MAG: TfoX/Sxy family protein [Acidimicrobiia bacterium]|nr:TfoX/Sxy family protein [Acidimicrobiia bacterium]